MEVTRGSAVIEGISLASLHWRAAAVRVANGTIFVGSTQSRYSRMASLPFLRGLYLWFGPGSTDMLWATQTPPPEELPPEMKRNPISRFMTAAWVHGLPLLGLYFFARSLGPSSWQTQLAVFAIQLAIYALYMLIIPRVFVALRRVFQYAGAMKMAMWQAGAPKTSLRDHPTWHWRSFTISVALVLLLIAVGSGLVLPHLPARYLVTLAVRVALLPLAIPLADEFQRLLTKWGHSTVLRVLFAPLVAIDLLASGKPDEPMLEVAEVCLSKLRALET